MGLFARSGLGFFYELWLLAAVEKAIGMINLQGEGSNKSPVEAAGDLAHYYQFGEIHHGKRFVKDADGNWGYTGDDVPLPAVYNMADIPAGGSPRPTTRLRAYQIIIAARSKTLSLFRIFWGSPCGDHGRAWLPVVFLRDQLGRDF